MRGLKIENAIISTEGWLLHSLFVLEQLIGEVGQICKLVLVFFIWSLGLDFGVELEDHVDFFFNDTQKYHHISIGDAVASSQLFCVVLWVWRLEDLTRGGKKENSYFQWWRWSWLGEFYLIALNSSKQHFYPVVQRPDQLCGVVIFEFELFWLKFISCEFFFKLFKLLFVEGINVIAWSLVVIDFFLDLGSGVNNILMIRVFIFMFLKIFILRRGLFCC